MIDPEGELVKVILLVFACHSSITFLLPTPTGFFVQLQQVFGIGSISGSSEKPYQQDLSNILQRVGARSQIGLTLKIKESPKNPKIRITIFRVLMPSKALDGKTSLCLPYPGEQW